LYPDKSLASEDTNPISSAAVPCRQMFWGLGGIRAGWRLIIYVLMVVVFSLLLQKGILKIPALAAIASVDVPAYPERANSTMAARKIDARRASALWRIGTMPSC